MNNRYGRRPGGSKSGGGGGGLSSRATPTTLCQKCLKKGHYSYECKEPRTDRPYVSRPSRTQQLMNPTLVPKLMSDESNELLRKKGIADEELAKKERERAQTQVSDRRQRSTSVASSSMSSQSVSSYSTNKSDSQTKMARPNHSLRKVLDDRPQKSRSSYGHKRRRSSSPAEDRGRDSSDSDRRTRRRFSDASPESRGRRRSVDHVSRRTARQGSRSPVRGGNQRFRRGEEHEQHSEYVPPKQPNIQSGQEHVEKTERKCSSPAGRVARDDRGRRQSHDDGESGGMYRSSDNHRRIASPAAPRPPQPPRERSLSPFSKRVALTRKLNGGS